MGVMLTNKNWETPYYAHIGDKDKLGNMWSANLHYLKRFDCGIGWNRY